MDDEVDRIPKALDKLRLELKQIQSSLETLQWYLDPARPPPAWPDTIRQIAQSTKRLDDLKKVIAEDRDFLRTLHVYPQTSFPGHDRGNILEQLLRKRLDPKAEDWIVQWSQPPAARQIDGVADGGAKPRTKAGEYESIWEWADTRVTDLINGFVGEYDSDYTLAEREEGTANVRTGLRRRLQVDEMDLGDDEDEEMQDGDGDAQEDGVQDTGVDTSLPPLQLEMVLKFMTTGQMSVAR